MLYQKGSDASGEHDEEPPLEEIEYSDDEEEAKAKTALGKSKKGKRKAPKRPASDLTQAQNAAFGGFNATDFVYEPLQRPTDLQTQAQGLDYGNPNPRYSPQNFAPPTVATMQQFQSQPPRLQRQATPMPMHPVHSPQLTPTTYPQVYQQPNTYPQSTPTYPQTAQPAFNFFAAPPLLQTQQPQYPLGMGRGGGYQNPYQQPPQNNNNRKN